jgi:CarD family transcriptional regulator
MESLKIGDQVIYPNQGLAVVEDIQEQGLAGIANRVFLLRLISNNTKIFVPSATAGEMGIRKLIAVPAVRKLFRFIKSGQVDITPDWKDRYKEHLQLMSTGTIFDLAFVLKCLFFLNLQKPLSFREKKMMEKAKEMIVSELSVVSASSESAVERKVLRSLADCFKGRKPSVEV